MTRRARAVLALALFAGASPLDRLGVAADSPTLSAGARHTCAIDAADALHCWGDDSDGQTRVPADVAGWRAVAAAKGGCHTCALALDGGVRCWGCDANGEVSGVPTVPGGNRWISVGAGKGVSCGVASVDRAVRCWGRFMPQVGANPWYGPWSRVAVGEDWVCALSANDAKARCRGWSANGQTNVPPSLANAAWLDLSAGFQHVCGVLATSPRSLACWGSGVAGESTPPTATEGEIAADPTSAIDSWGAVSAGTHVTCGIVGAQRRLKCWGKALDYAPGSEYAAAFGEFGLVAGAADVATWGTIVAGGVTHRAVTGRAAAARVRGTSSRRGSTTRAPSSRRRRPGFKTRSTIRTSSRTTRGNGRRRTRGRSRGGWCAGATRVAARHSSQPRA